MGFIHDQKRAVLARQLAQGLMIAGIRQHHAAVGHHRFGQNRRHIALCQRRLQRRKVVEFNHDRGLCKVNHLPDQPGPLDRAAIEIARHRVIDRTVIAARKEQYPGPCRQRPRHPD